MPPSFWLKMLDLVLPGVTQAGINLLRYLEMRKQNNGAGLTPEQSAQLLKEAEDNVMQM